MSHLRLLSVLTSIALLAAAVGCGPSPAAKPTSYERWQSKDNTFAIDYPANWDAKGGGKHGVQWAKFTSGGAEVKINVNLSDSLMSEGADNALLDNDLSEEQQKELHPIEAIHDRRREEMKEDMSGYEEAEDPTRIRPALGEGRMGEFSANAGIGQKIKGYHVNVLSNDRRITVICKCAESDWKMLKPEFEKMINSLGLN